LFREGQGLLCGSGIFSVNGGILGAEALPGAWRWIVSECGIVKPRLLILRIALIREGQVLFI
jgi:hypothetical protein